MFCWLFYFYKLTLLLLRPPIDYYAYFYDSLLSLFARLGSTFKLQGHQLFLSHLINFESRARRIRCFIDNRPFNKKNIQRKCPIWDEPSHFSISTLNARFVERLMRGQDFYGVTILFVRDAYNCYWTHNTIGCYAPSLYWYYRLEV